MSSPTFDVCRSDLSTVDYFIPADMAGDPGGGRCQLCSINRLPNAHIVQQDHADSHQHQGRRGPPPSEASFDIVTYIRPAEAKNCIF